VNLLGGQERVLVLGFARFVAGFVDLDEVAATAAVAVMGDNDEEYSEAICVGHSCLDLFVLVFRFYCSISRP
jgi:hypothetical protein